MTGLLAQIDHVAARRPDALAIVAGEERATYGDLVARSAAVAAALARLRLPRESRAALVSDRSIDAIAAMLGALRAGLAVAPVDPYLPRERMRLLLAGAACVLAEPDVAASLRFDGPVAELRGAAGEVGRSPAADPLQAAFVLHTSGSTGGPKGVVLTHGSLAWYVASFSRLVGIGPADVVHQFASFSFDAALEEIFSALTCGARLVLRPPGPLESFAALAARIERERVTILDLPTAVWHEWMRAPAEPAGLPPWLRALVVGGEQASLEAYRTWLDRAPPGCSWMNLYGPAEATISSTALALTSGHELDEPPPVGLPLPGVRALVLDGQLRPAAAGELHLGGPGLARGYLDAPALTAERFVPAGGGERLYRTGDAAEVDAAGCLRLRGRVDLQIKLRGVRIEPAEVEAALASAAPGAEVAVALHAAKEARLVAYIVPPPGGTVVPEALRARLARSLPAAMVPSAYVVVGALPRAASGKVDRSRLPAPAPIPAAGGAVEPARTRLEAALVEAFAEVTGAPAHAASAFSELGGSSLSALRVAARLEDAIGRELPPAEILRRQTPRALAVWLESAAETGQGDFPPIRRTPRDRPIPLSFAQERVFYLERMDPDSRAYRFQAVWTLIGPIDVDALRGSLDRLIARHEVLRTTFVLDGDRPVQRILPPSPAAFEVVDLGDARHQAAVDHAIAAALARPLEVAALPLVRWTLVRLDGREHRLVQLEHHFVHDGWSFARMVGEILDEYERAAARRAAGDDAAGIEPDMAGSRLQFADYAAWERTWVESAAAARQLAYWRGKLAGAPARLALPTDRPRPPRADHRGAVVRTWLPPGAIARARQLAREEGATLHMALLAAFAATLGRWSCQRDFCLGTAVANRRRVETESMLGMFVNMVALRVDLTGRPSFRELLRRVRDTAFEAYANQDTPFDRVVQALAPPREPGVHPLVQVDFSSHDSPYPRLRRGALSVGIQDGVATGSAKFDLSAVAVPRENGQVEVDLTYAVCLFDRTTAERLARGFALLFEAGVDRPDRLVDELPLLAGEERAAALAHGRGRALDPPRPLLAAIDEAAARYADAIAIADGDRRLTYRQLAARSRAAGARLAGLGLPPESRVALIADRSIEAVIAIIGALRTGLVVVPLDPAAPAERLGRLLADSGARALISTGGGTIRFAGPILELAEVGGDAPAEPDDRTGTPALPAGPAPGPLHAACVLYTSGSSGRPKGVILTHEALAWYVAAFTRLVGLTERDRVYQFAALVFDVALEEVLAALAAGARLVLRPPGPLEPFSRLVARLRRERVTLVHLPTAVWHEWMRSAAGARLALPELRALVVGGEAATADAYRAWLGVAPPGCRWINTYGPTEATVSVTGFARDPNQPLDGDPPIGRPLDGARAHVLDALLEPSPAGVPGELYLGGPGVARGYLDDPALTAARFLPDPFGRGDRLYRTGDRALRRADGALQFLGRLDRQVKLRGHRIEPGEVEAAISRLVPLARASVVLRADGSGPRLVAYVAPPAGVDVDPDRLRDQLAGVLPAAMVPSAIEVLGRLPLTASGKLDLAALPAPVAAPPRDADPRPLHPLEPALLAMWRDLLGGEIDRHDDFFHAGGNSLSLLRLQARIAQAFGVDLDLADMFTHRTVSRLAELVERTQLAAVSAEELSALASAIEGLSDDESMAVLAGRERAAKVSP